VSLATTNHGPRCTLTRKHENWTFRLCTFSPLGCIFNVEKQELASAALPVHIWVFVVSSSEHPTCFHRAPFARCALLAERFFDPSPSPHSGTHLGRPKNRPDSFPLSDRMKVEPSVSPDGSAGFKLADVAWGVGDVVT
jgi:hypothetical protein